MILPSRGGRQARAGILARMTTPSMPEPDAEAGACTRYAARLARLPGTLLRLALCIVLGASVVGFGPATASAATLAQLKAQLAAIRQDSVPAGNAFEKAHTDLENTQYRIRQTDARIKAQTKKLAAAEKRLGGRADAMYREGSDDGLLGFILGSQTWEDFVTRLDYVTIIASNDAALVEEVKVTRANLQKDRVQLVADAKVQTKQVASLKVRYDALQSRLASKRAEYNRVLGQIAAQMARENPGHGSYPAGPNGMVFPVRGNNYYADTWGAPRSGGRHHMGTDIMANRGTPVVAVSSGSARVHWSSLGGKSITLTGSNGWSYYYAHLNGYAISGGHVRAGQVISYVGNTGNASGGACHLHFQMGPRGNWVDPYPYLRAME
jgi:murein DD-endopeptidase MepM/ murein hydrolase activator NlpD